MSHESGQNRVGGENGGLVLVGESANDGVVGGGDFEEVSILEAFEAAFVFGRDAIVSAVVVFQSAAEEKVFGFGNGEGELGEGAEGDLVVHVPLGLDIHGGFEDGGFAALLVRV